MKPFNLQEFKKNPSRKVVTRDGKATARIICTDCKSEYPIIALLSYSENSEGCEAYTADGRFSIDEECNSDLFFAPVKREGYINLFRKVEGIIGGYLQDTKEDAIKEIRDKSCHVATIHIEWEE